MSYDLWLLQGAGGPCDDGLPPSEYEQAQDAFYELSPRSRFRLRRLDKAKYRRRRRVPEWRARQRREDINGQVIY